MEIAQIVLEYLKVVLEFVSFLAWPAVVLIVLLHYENYISRFLKRVSEETEEISTSLFTLKLRERMQEIGDAIPANEKDLKERVKSVEQELAIQQFIEVAPQFFTEPLSTRIHLVKIIEDLALSLKLSTILRFASSNQKGERVGAGIALRQHILANADIVKSQDVVDALRLGIRDEYSRVRYRYIEAIGANKSLSLQFIQELRRMAKEDKSPGVREQATRVLASISA